LLYKLRPETFLQKLLNIFNSSPDQNEQLDRLILNDEENIRNFNITKKLISDKTIHFFTRENNYYGSEKIEILPFKEYLDQFKENQISNIGEIKNPINVISKICKKVTISDEITFIAFFADESFNLCINNIMLEFNNTPLDLKDDWEIFKNEMSNLKWCITSQDPFLRDYYVFSDYKDMSKYVPEFVINHKDFIMNNPNLIQNFIQDVIDNKFILFFNCLNDVIDYVIVDGISKVNIKNNLWSVQTLYHCITSFDTGILEMNNQVFAGQVDNLRLWSHSDEFKENKTVNQIKILEKFGITLDKIIKFEIILKVIKI